MPSGVRWCATPLEDRLYGLTDAVSGNALEASVSRLRRQLARAGGDEIAVETIRGIGYRLVVRTPRADA